MNQFLLLIFLVLVYPFSEASQIIDYGAKVKTIVKEHQDENSKWSSYYQYHHRNLLNNEASRQRMDVLPSEINLRNHLMVLRRQVGDRLDLDIGLQYTDMDITLKGAGREIHSGSRGLNDSRLGLRSYGQFRNISLESTLYLSLPTGSIDKRDKGRLLPYQGQTGSGTYDAIYEGESRYHLTKNNYFRNKVQWIQRIGQNSQGYRLGNKGKLISEINFPIYKKYLTGMIGGVYKTWGRVKGENPMIKEIEAQMPFPMEIDDPFSKSGHIVETYAALKSGLHLGGAGVLLVELGRPMTSYVSGNETELKTSWYAYSHWITRF